MGQYHVLVNFDKKEYVHPYALGNGLKLAEQFFSDHGTKDALFVLMASKSNGRGGGDLEDSGVVGRWAGDRVAFIGDYTEKSDHPEIRGIDKIYGYCGSEGGENGWENITDKVAAYLETVLDIEFVGDGWKDIVTKTKR
jgi:hypothetical protein